MTPEQLMFIAIVNPGKWVRPDGGIWDNVHWTTRGCSIDLQFPQIIYHPDSCGFSVHHFSFVPMLFDRYEEALLCLRAHMRVYA